MYPPASDQQRARGASSGVLGLKSSNFMEANFRLNLIIVASGLETLGDEAENGLRERAFHDPMPRPAATHVWRGSFYLSNV